MQRQTSPKAAQGGTDFAMLPSAHRKPERRDSKAFKGQMQELSQRAAQTPAHMSTLEAILARMTARPTEKDVQEAERLQKVMAGAED